jgi:hypothetical protein
VRVDMPTYMLSVNRVEVHNQKASTDHSDDDWLMLVCTVINPVTKDVQTLPAITTKIGSTIHTGDILTGPFRSNPITTDDSNIVIVNYLVTNLGSTNETEKQFAQAVQITDKVVGVAGPIVGAAVGLLLGGDPAGGFKVGQQIAKGLDTAISTASDIFDFLHIHVGPPDCNGEVLHDTLTFLPDQLKQAMGQSASREYPNDQQPAPPQPEGCGLAPHTKVTFMIIDPFSLRQYMLAIGSDASKGIRRFMFPVLPLPHLSGVRALMGV